VSETETLELVLRAIDNATAEIREMSEGLKEMKESNEELEASNDDAGFSFTELKSAIDLGAKAVQAIGQVYDATVSKTLAYGESVRELSRNIGATPEEASKLIQAADDVKVSSETLTSALNIAIRKGVDPTVEGLGRLADEYNAIADPIARTKFLMDSFGKSGADLAPLMQLGAAGIKELGDQAEATGLVLSGPTLQAMRDHEQAVDGLTDSWDGFVVGTTSKVIPALTGLVDSLNEGIEKQRLVDELIREGILTQEEYAAMVGRTRGMGVPIEELRGIWEGTVGAQRQAWEELAHWEDEARNATTTAEALNAIMQGNAAVSELAAGVYDEAAKALNELNIGDATRLSLETQIKLITGELTQEEVERSSAITALTKQLELGNITQAQYLDALGRLASGADTAKGALDRLKSSIESLPSHKRIHIDVNQTFGGAAGEAGLGSAPVIVPDTGGTRPTSGGFAGGGSFTVPGTPGGGDRPYLIFAKPGEQGFIAPPGQAAAPVQIGPVYVNSEIDIEMLARRVTELQRGGVA
jgi:hypothetical protein